MVSKEAFLLEFSSYCPFAGTSTVSVPLEAAYLEFDDPDDLDTRAIIASIVEKAQEAEPDGAGELVKDCDGRVHARRDVER
jgi:hypothetical protein